MYKENGSVLDSKGLPITELALSDNARLVLSKRYLRKNDAGQVIERPEDMFLRVAECIASADLKYDEEVDLKKISSVFYDQMTSLKFMPNSPTLMNAGRELGQLSACFVLPIDDSIESIFEAVKHTAMIHKSGGGTGFSFSRIRAEGDRVKSTHGVASGPVSFMTIFDVATETIKQGGTRRGANMGILRIDHPDIESFITAKRRTDRLNNFNISVALTEAFMEAVENKEDYTLYSPRDGSEVKKINAFDVFETIVQSAWESGEPGIVFLDRINHSNPTPHLGSIESTNPCGEQPLLPYESCNLGSINLGCFVKGNVIDYEALKFSVHTAVHFLDNVIDVNRFPLPEIEEMTIKTRKIGLGIMGFADLLIRLGVSYGSKESIKIAADIMAFIDRESKAASVELGRTRGSFPAYKKSKFDSSETPFMRNATTTTIAPTGTISIIANSSSGIEPLFAVSYIRKVLGGHELVEVHPQFVEAIKKSGKYSSDLMVALAATGSLQENSQIPDEIKKIFVTSMDVSPDEHIAVQAAFQEHTDNAVSKTINFPEEATVEDIERAYLLAWKKGLKGLTIYRYGSRPVQVLNLKKEQKSQEKSISTIEKSETRGKIAPRPRPLRTTGFTERVKTGCGNLYVTINWDEQDFCEVFAQMGKAGGCAACQIEAESRLVSLALRSGISPEVIVKQLSGIRCPQPTWQDGGQILSCPDAMAKVLKAAGEIELEERTEKIMTCPECGAALEPEEGCMLCRSCGFSKCG